MARLGRRGLIISAGVLATPALRPARADPIQWRIAHTAPRSFPLHKRLVEAAEIINEKGAGRIAVTIRPEGEMGAQIGVLNQMRNGTLEMCPVTGQLLAANQQLAGLPLTGFAWAGYPQVWRAMDGDLGATIRDQMAMRLNITMMETVWDFGFRIITTARKPIRVPDDLRGLRLRTPVEADLVSLFQALGASPVAMPLGEAVAALRRRAIDGQEGLLALVAAGRFAEVQGACSLTNHVWDGQWMCTANATWKRLPPDLQKLVAETLNAAGLKQRADTAEAEAATRKQLETAGMSFTVVDQAPFRRLLGNTGYYGSLKSKLGPQYWAALEKYAGRLV